MSLIDQLNNASRLKIVESFKNLNSNFSRDKWLSESSIYNSNFVYETDPTANKNDYKEYLASSVLLHLSDAWSYISRAINASLSGDSISARHLGYYAELRATMALLASEGIGVHNRKHYFIDSLGNIKRLTLANNKSGTHIASWEILKIWSKTSSAKTLLENTITFEEKTIKEWIDNISVAPWSALAETIFEDWGMDLKVFSEDHKIRNAASYNTTQLLIDNEIDICDNIQFFYELWGLFNPSETSKFASIDKELIRRSLLKVKDTMDDSLFKQKIKDFLNLTLDSTPKKEHILDYFTNSQESSFFDMAETEYSDSKDAIKDPKNHLQMIARASLLLRLATGSTKQLILDAGRNFDEINFWWNDLAIASGIWDGETTYDSTNLNDLWLDIDEFVLQEIDEKECNNAVSLHTIKNDIGLSKSLNMFSECERIMLWGLSS